MVSIKRNDNETIFEIIGLHKLWTLKSEIIIPNEHIVKIYQDPTEIKELKSIRVFGTHVPYVIKAGTFYQYEDSSKIFLDIVNEKNVIIVELKDEQYKKIMVEVENPIEIIHLFETTKN